MESMPEIYFIIIYALLALPVVIGPAALITAHMAIRWWRQGKKTNAKRLVYIFIAMSSLMFLGFVAAKNSLGL